MADHIRYDLLTQQALRGVVRSVLADAAKKNALPGEHHFYITFDTRADGVQMSPRLRGQYPEEMTIILQHQFWDLTVEDDAFEVSLSFGGIPEHLVIPFATIKGFFDPSVQFGLQFEEIVEEPSSKPDNKPDMKPGPAPVDAASDGRNAKLDAKFNDKFNAKLNAKLDAKPDAKPDAKSDAKPSTKPAAVKPAPAGDAKDGPAANNADKDQTPAAGGAEVVSLDRFRKK